MLFFLDPDYRFHMVCIIMPQLQQFCLFVITHIGMGEISLEAENVDIDYLLLCSRTGNEKMSRASDFYFLKLICTFVLLIQGECVHYCFNYY